MTEATREAENAAVPVTTRKTWVYHAAIAVVRTGSLLYLPLRVEGAEHLPAEGPVLVVANHTSWLDIPALAAAGRKRHLSFVARRSLAKSRFMDWLMRGCGAVLIEPGSSDRAALRDVNAHLAEGDAVVMFPEGTRSPDGRVKPFKGGMALAVRRAGAPVVPAAVSGSHRAWPKGRALPRPGRLVVRFGPPLDPRTKDLGEVARRAVQGLLEPGEPGYVAVGDPAVPGSADGPGRGPGPDGGASGPESETPPRG